MADSGTVAAAVAAVAGVRATVRMDGTRAGVVLDVAGLAPAARESLELAVRAAAEQLPVADASIDSVVCNLVLCTALDPAGALREIARVLRPGGQLLFVEHVRADSARWARWQERARAAWSAFACGCQLTRETLATLEASPLKVVDVKRRRVRTVPLVHSIIWGRAIRPA